MPEAGKVPGFERFMWPTLEALKKLGGSATVDELDDDVAVSMNLTEAQLSQLHNQGPRTEFSYRSAWARTYLGKAGAITNSERGVWAITPHGQTLKITDMGSLAAKVRGSYEVRERIGAISGPAQLRHLDQDRWKDELLSVLKNLPPAGFERLCQRVLREQGFDKVEVTGRTGDGGIDGVGILSVSLLSFKIVFQCKRYRGTVGAAQVRDFRGAMQGRGEKGLLLTTGQFTPDAVKEANREGAPVIDLVDGDRLCNILKDLKFGVTTNHVESIAVERTWFDSV